ncbi:hypothetical protein GALMADRAFT_230043 [Galerina marginata CBS 339.88]|uniref:Uncharacterized protein n=1 Tax=Galerina marginata (strain CBS 339.88) TaxID=685588 RepID=A0A067SRN3_GALM3|nr:hypothetical protein GALMADRAFT_230043 [Galerina marginata CBS 339.88]
MEIIRPFLYFSVRILRIFVPKKMAPISPHPLIPALGPMDIGHWATTILSFHSSPAAVNEWQITSIRWYKHKSRIEHEYPVFTIQRKSVPLVEMHLRFDRRSSPEALRAKKDEVVVDSEIYISLTEKQQKDIRRIVEQERQFILEKGINRIFHLSMTSSEEDDGFEPEDTIMHSRLPCGVTRSDSSEVDLLVAYSNFRHHFTLRDLAIISKAVVEESEAYLLLSQQSYWLTRMMVDISIAKYLPQQEDTFEEAFRRAGRISRLPFAPPINIGNPTEVSTLVEKVNRAIAENDQQVWARYMDGEGGRIAAEEALAQLRERIKSERLEDRIRDLEAARADVGVATGMQ